eukprot:scaffold5872_cov104-Isochrysis_galbana.AAC.2
MPAGRGLQTNKLLARGVDRRLNRIRPILRSAARGRASPAPNPPRVLAQFGLSAAPPSRPARTPAIWTCAAIGAYLRIAFCTLQLGQGAVDLCRWYLSRGRVAVVVTREPAIGRHATAGVSDGRDDPFGVLLGRDQVARHVVPVERLDAEADAGGVRYRRRRSQAADERGLGRAVRLEPGKDVDTRAADRTCVGDGLLYARHVLCLPMADPTEPPIACRPVTGRRIDQHLLQPVLVELGDHCIRGRFGVREQGLDRAEAAPRRKAEAIYVGRFSETEARTGQGEAVVTRRTGCEKDILWMVQGALGKRGCAR